MNASTILTRARRRVGDRDKRQIDDPLALDLLNESLEELSIRSESIVYGQYRSCIADQGKYGLPDTFLSVKFCEFNNRGDKYFLLPDTIKKNQYLISNEIGSQPLYYTISGQSSQEKVVAPVTAVISATGFAVANLPDSVAAGDSVINTDNADASATITAVNSGDIFVDQWRGQDDNIQVGDELTVLSSDRATTRGTLEVESLHALGGIKVDQYLDGLVEGDIVRQADRRVSTTLKGWTTTESEAGEPFIYVGDWGGIQINDVVRIVSAYRANKTLVISPPPTFTDSIGDESIFIFGAFQHREVTQDDIDANNDRLEIDLELISALTNLLCMKFSEVINTIEDGMTERYEVAFETEYHRVIGGITRKIREYQSLWASGALTPVRQETAGIVDPIGHAYNLVTIA